MHPAALDQFTAKPERAGDLPRALKRRFPVGRVCPLPAWNSAVLRAGWQAYNSLPMYAASLAALAFRFSGKRFPATELREIVLSADGMEVWRSDAALARMLERFRDGKRATRGYAFIHFGDHPAGVGYGVLTLPRFRSVEVRLTLGDVIAPRVDWWGVFV